MEERAELQGRIDDALDCIITAINAGQGVVSANILRDILDPRRERKGS